MIRVLVQMHMLSNPSATADTVSLVQCTDSLSGTLQTTQPSPIGPSLKQYVSTLSRNRDRLKLTIEAAADGNTRACRSQVSSSIPVILTLCCTAAAAADAAKVRKSIGAPAAALATSGLSTPPVAQIILCRATKCVELVQDQAAKQAFR